MEQTSASGADHLKRHRAQLVVAEVVGEPLITDDASTPQLVDVIDELVLVDPGDGGQQLDREGTSDDGGHLGQAPGAFRELRQPCPEHGADRGGERRLAIGGDPGPVGFDDEQGVALRLGPESRSRGRVDRPFGPQERGEGAGRGLVEAVQWNRGHRLVVAQRLDQSDEGMVLAHLFRANRSDDEDGSPAPRSDDEADRLDGLGVTPLKVVDDDQVRTALGGDRSTHRIEDPMALGHLTARPLVARSLDGQELREEPSQLCPPDGLQRPDVSLCGVRPK